MEHINYGVDRGILDAGQIAEFGQAIAMSVRDGPSQKGIYRVVVIHAHEGRVLGPQTQAGDDDTYSEDGQHAPGSKPGFNPHIVKSWPWPRGTLGRRHAFLWSFAGFETGELAVECGGIDAKHLGGSRLVPALRPEDPLDVGSLDDFQRWVGW